MIHTATFITRTENVTYSIGRYIEKRDVETKNFVGLDGKVSVTVQSFILRLVENGRLPWEARKTTGHTFTDAYLTKLLNENIDLFKSTLEL